MTYATATELLQRFDAEEIAQRADRNTPRLVSGKLLADVAAVADLSGYTLEEAAAAAVALNVVQRALNDARDTIDSHIGGRYPLPIYPVPPILPRVACDLARFYLYDDQVTDTVKARFDACMKLLRDVANGSVGLGADSTSGVQPASSAGAELVSGGRVWDRQNGSAFL